MTFGNSSTNPNPIVQKRKERQGGETLGSRSPTKSGSDRIRSQELPLPPTLLPHYTRDTKRPGVREQDFRPSPGFHPPPPAGS